MFFYFHASNKKRNYINVAKALPPGWGFNILSMRDKTQDVENSQI